jgi:hypothetical protein
MMEQMTGYALWGDGNMVMNPEKDFAEACDAYQKAMELLEKSIDSVEYKGRTMKEWSKILADRQWIKTSEKLPPTSVDVLCYFPAKDYGPKIMVAYKEIGGGPNNWFSESSRWGIVTHWMPLPEPPKEE